MSKVNKAYETEISSGVQFSHKITKQLKHALLPLAQVSWRDPDTFPLSNSSYFTKIKTGTHSKHNFSEIARLSK